MISKQIYPKTYCS